MALHFREATSIFGKTLPFVFLRIGIGILLGLLTVLYFTAIWWLLTLIQGGSVSGMIMLAVFLVAGLLFWKAWQLVSKYILYMVKVGHIAVIAHVVETGEVPDNQLSYGKDQLKEYKMESTGLFALDQLVKAVVKQLNSQVVSLRKWLPTTNSVDTMIKMLTWALSMAGNYIDEAIIAYLFVDDEPNKWKSAKDGVVLYGKNWKPVLLSTLAIVTAMYVAGFAVLLALTPLAGVFGGLSTTFEAIGWLVVGGIGLAIYSGLIKPWVKTVVITTFLVESRGQEPDSQTVDWVKERSSKFQELMDKADEEAAKQEGAETDPSTPDPTTPA